MTIVRVACVQATPAVLDARGSVEKACELIGEAGANGARLVALPEAFVPLYPNSAWASASARFSHEAAELHRRLWGQSVDVPGPLTERLGAAARRARTWVAIGVNERDPARPGTLWNTLVWLAPDGRLAGRHRKLMPTLHERVFWGQGAGDDLGAHRAEFGRLVLRAAGDRAVQLVGRDRLHPEGRPPVEVQAGDQPGRAGVADDAGQVVDEAAHRADRRAVRRDDRRRDAVERAVPQRRGVEQGQLSGHPAHSAARR